MVKFLTQEWIELGKKYMNDKLDPTADLKNVSTTLLNVIEHVPPDDTTMYFYLCLDKGKLTEFEAGSDPTFENKEAQFVIRAGYGTFKGIIQGEMSMGLALLKNRLKLKGSKMKALQLIKPLDKVITSLQEVTDEFEE
ncbi:MAG: SCP2 sterol-binding domain-containing protein [Candidatus Thermoplasmatota archaeon]|nr:SCP2 sterol-binding domain-containing protein [Candidatus Thermoplasmatota archaeon]MBU1941744.1 SCP2 sterol-binding domain-containing protein [Candidatus Thermoplasmatota archaeon]